MLVKHCSIWELHLFTIRQSLIQSLHLSIKTLPSLSSMLLQISSVIAFEKPPFWRKTMDQSTVQLICCVFLWSCGLRGGRRDMGGGIWGGATPPLMQQNTKLVLRQCVAIVAKQMLNLGNQGGDKTPTNAELALSGEKANWVKFNKNQNRSDEAGYGRWRWFVVMQHNTELVLASKNLNSQFLLSWQEVLVGLHRYLN